MTAEPHLETREAPEFTRSRRMTRICFFTKRCCLRGKCDKAHRRVTRSNRSSILPNLRTASSTSELRLGVRIHPQSRVESDQTCKYAAETIWLTYNAHERECLHIGRIESSRVPRVLLSQESWCHMFHFRQPDSSDRAWRLLFCVGKWMQKDWFF